MNITVFSFIAMAAIVAIFAAATMLREFNIKYMSTQTGDSSIGRKSVNWLGAVAFLTALAICIFLV